MRSVLVQPLRTSLVALAALLGATGCGASPGPDEAEIAVSAAPLTAGVNHVIFTAEGDGIADGHRPYLGTRGSLPTDGSSTASFILPEGRKTIRAYGFDEFAASGVTAYRLRDTCSATLELQSRTRRQAALTCTTPTLPAAGEVGLERIYLNGDYLLDENAVDAGSFDGSNIARIFIQGAQANAEVTVWVNAESTGCFESLPTVWPDPSTWPGCSGATDSSGNWTGYLVAKPGSAGMVWNYAITVGVSDTYPVAVRIGGLARVDASAK